MAGGAESFKIDPVSATHHSLIKAELTQLGLDLSTPIGVSDLGKGLALHGGDVRRVALHVAPILATHIVEGVRYLPQRANLAGFHQGRKDVVVSHGDLL